MKSALHIACSRHNLQQVRDFVLGHLDGHSFADVCINQVVLAVDEVVANFIIHANGEDESQFLNMTLGLENMLLEIEIVDHGNTIFLPNPAAPAPDLRESIKQSRKGGMGMVLVNRLMDRVEFFTRDNHTVCHLSKTLR